jgi:hypothetical protein
LAKVAIFTTNVNAENQTLINHKCICGEPNRHFCQTVLQAGVLSVDARLSIVTVSSVRWLGGSFGFFQRWSVY